MRTIQLQWLRSVHIDYLILQIDHHVVRQNVVRWLRDHREFLEQHPPDKDVYGEDIDKYLDEMGKDQDTTESVEAGSEAFESRWGDELTLYGTCTSTSALFLPSRSRL